MTICNLAFDVCNSAELGETAHAQSEFHKKWFDDKVIAHLIDSYSWTSFSLLILKNLEDIRISDKCQCKMAQNTFIVAAVIIAVLGTCGCQKSEGYNEADTAANTAECIAFGDMAVLHFVERPLPFLFVQFMHI